MPYLRAVAFDREYRGISPSMAGNGARLIWLKATTDYAIDPDKRAFAILGVGTHAKLSNPMYTHNVLSEEPLREETRQEIADLLEEDEYSSGRYILTDFKSFGSFKVRRALGIQSRKIPVLDNYENPVLLKSGPNKGRPKTINENFQDQDFADVRNETLQLNRYRMGFESKGFPVSKMCLFVIIRDGGLQATINQGITTNTIKIPIPRLPDENVITFYDELERQVNNAFKVGYVHKCGDYESWNGRRCDGYCEVSEKCKELGP